MFTYKHKTCCQKFFQHLDIILKPLFHRDNFSRPPQSVCVFRIFKLNCLREYKTRLREEGIIRTRNSPDLCTKLLRKQVITSIRYE